MTSFARRGEIGRHSASILLLRSHGLTEILDFRNDKVPALRGLRPKLPVAAEPPKSMSIVADVRAESAEVVSWGLR